jgi:hypothetical protein
MIKITLSIISAYLFLGILGISIFLFTVPITIWQEFYASIPSTTYKKQFNQAVIQGNFQKANTLLNQQADLANFLGMNENMLQQLVANTSALMETARNENQYISVLPWLSRLVDLAPNDLEVGLMTLETKIRLSIMVKDKTLERYKNITPALDRIYRAAIGQKLNQGKKQAIDKWCKLYGTSQLGSLSAKHYQGATFANQGMGSFLIEIKGISGESVTLPHAGFELNRTSDFDFEFHQAPQQKAIRLHFPVFPGVKVVLNSIRFIDIEGEKVFLPEDFLILPKTGYLANKNEFLITSMKGDIVTMFPQEGQFPASDIIRLQMKFSRLPVYSGQECLTE